MTIFRCFAANSFARSLLMWYFVSLFGKIAVALVKRTIDQRGSCGPEETRALGALSFFAYHALFQVDGIALQRSTSVLSCGKAWGLA